MHLKQPVFNYIACGPFTKNKERIQKFKETRDTKYENKACFQHDIAYGDFKDLARRTASDKALKDKAFHITKIPKYDRYQKGLASVVYKFFNKKSTGSGIKNEIKQNQQLAEELHKPIQLISKFNEKIRFLQCVTDIYSKDAWVIPLKDKKGVTIVNAFEKIYVSKRKRNKIQVDKISEFYNRSMKSWPEKNDIEMYSTHDEGKSVVAERFIRTLKNKIYKHMTAVSIKKCVY